MVIRSNGATGEKSKDSNRAADWQSAVSRIGNPQTLEQTRAAPTASR
jgi:hypothetical protein